MRLLLTAIVLLAPLAAEAAVPEGATGDGEVTFQQQPAAYDPLLKAVKIPVKATNVSSRLINVAWVECAALSADGSLLANNVYAFENMRPSQAVYGYVAFFDLTSTNLRFDCRLGGITRF
jgi:hypothetical protein